MENDFSPVGFDLGLESCSVLETQDGLKRQRDVDKMKLERVEREHQHNLEQVGGDWGEGLFVVNRRPHSREPFFFVKQEPFCRNNRWKLSTVGSDL